MTTNYMYPTQTHAYITPPNSQTLRYGAQPFSPTESATTAPANTSPTSPRNPNMLPAATRQLRPPKSPLYTPAVLRPTKREHRPSPLTPPRSLHGSTESLDKNDLPKSLTRQAGDDQDNETVIPEVDEEEEAVPEAILGEVTGPPTRTHWKADADAAICDAPICQKTFSFFERRHHCRHCGHVFCHADSAYTIPLDQDAEFHPAGCESRACKHCWEQYRRWTKASGSSSGDTSISTGSTSAPGTPVICMGRGRKGSGGAELKSPIAASVPRDWNWSSF